MIATATRRVRLPKSAPVLLPPSSDRDYRRMSRIVRAAVPSRKGVSHCPIYTVDGFAPPKLEGRSYHWTTPAGRPVYHPSAYARHFGRPVYHGSTLRIVVGRGWLIRAVIRAESAELAARVRERCRMMRAARSVRLVTLADALKAGLCESGTRAWCAAVGLDPERGATLAQVVACYRRRPESRVLDVIRFVLS